MSNVKIYSALGVAVAGVAVWMGLMSGGDKTKNLERMVGVPASADASNYCDAYPESILDIKDEDGDSAYSVDITDRREALRILREGAGFRNNAELCRYLEEHDLVMISEEHSNPEFDDYVRD